MKTLVYIAGGLMTITSVLAKTNGETSPNKEIKIGEVKTINAYYGVNIGQASTGSGHGSSTNLNLNVQCFNKVLEVGAMFDAKDNQVKGIDVLYKHFIGFRSGNFYKKTIKPFFNYNFVYHMPTQIIVNPSYYKSDNFNPAEVNGKITTFEHAIGLGLQINLLKKVYVEGSADFGVYFGARYKGETPNTWGIHKDNYGFVPSFKLGLGFQF